MRTGAARLAAGLLVVPLFLTACSSGGDSKSDGKPSGGVSEGPAGGGGKNKPPAAPAALTITPADGAKSVETDGVFTVNATSGKVSSVVVTDADGKAVEGAASADGATWTPKAPLANGTKYTVVAKAANADGAEVTANSSFTTVSAAKTFDYAYKPDDQDGGTLGVGGVISIKFDKPVKDKAAIERNLSVVSEPATEGSWSWLTDHDGNDRVDYRPKEYWKPGTKVTWAANLAGAKSGDGTYGTKNRGGTFTVRDSIVATADLATKHLTIARNGQVVNTLPISAGGPSYPTWTGVMVVMDKVDGIDMDSETVGLGDAYNMKNVRYAVHLSASGTYSHAAPWNAGKFGKVHDSHGCIGLSTADAKILFDTVNSGDVVEVINGTEKQLAPGNGFGDWNVDWETWVKNSALAGAAQ
ncbi:Ig-like domain-containing protein [Yinghuangia sp. ASG 101]|uniref:L,D-transpeptidase n=1 Tax=Yinghuangia sp. ASG 101 TaxID=2896848 RepID=UPI001E4E333C|nr:Ig-like domain-containing protein [Yinghuangia sp. ASG 101]UGQ09978.1 Ig-like domain-containing protein [Yinghuangia sp. ASG 101]